MRFANLIKTVLTVFSVFFSFILPAAEPVWDETPAGLPYCRHMNAGADEAFLLGNYRMNILAHPDGVYEILSGERVWARFNADPVRPNSGRNRATLFNGLRSTELVSSSVKSEFYTGVGFARYDYTLRNGIRCSRMISVMPSEEINGGQPCFVITVTITNRGRGTEKIDYEEAFSPMCLPVSDQELLQSERVVSYPMNTEISFRCLHAYFTPTPQKFVSGATVEGASPYEFSPLSVFLYSDRAFLGIADGEFTASFSDIKLKPREQEVFHIVVGLSDEKNTKELAEEVMSHAEYSEYGLFEALWKKQLPDYSAQTNWLIRKDLYMDAYELESSAVYDAYFKETFIPSESRIATVTGENLSNREHLQRAVHACQTNPELAKSVMRYVMKHAGSDGRIYEGNTGFGYIPASYSKGYDLQIYFFNLLTEYLATTGDYGFLEERLTIYPMDRGEYVTVMQLVERFFQYLRDVAVREADESVIENNYDIARPIFPAFIEQMRESGKASDLFLKALEEYEKSIS